MVQSSRSPYGACAVTETERHVPQETFSMRAVVSPAMWFVRVHLLTVGAWWLNNVEFRDRSDEVLFACRGTRLWG